MTDQAEPKFLSIPFQISEMKVGFYQPVLVSPIKQFTVMVYVPLLPEYIQNANDFGGVIDPEPVMTLEGARWCYNQLHHIAKLDERKPETTKQEDEELLNDDNWTTEEDSTI